MANGSGSPASEVGGRTLQQIMEDTFNQNVRPDVPDRFRTKVVSYEYQGKDARGRRVYKIALRQTGAHQGSTRVNYTTRAFDGENLVAPDFTSPRVHPDDEDRLPDHLGAKADQAALDRAKERWHQTILGMTLSPLDEQNLTRFIDRWNGNAQNLDQIMQRKVEEAALKGIDATVGGGGDGDDEGAIDPYAGLQDALGSIGSGFSGPSYTAPDRRVVEDFVTGALTSLLGTVPSEEMLQSLADLYMQDHRRNFDRPSQEIDPAQSVQEAIRDTEQYQTIHALRPESEDERKWVLQRKQAAAKGGLATDRQEQFAIDQAAVGGDPDDVEGAAALEQFATSGSARGTTLEDRMRQAIQGVFSGVIQ